MVKNKECEYCGSNDNVKFQNDPYESEINDDYTLHWICEKCSDIKLMEI